MDTKIRILLVDDHTLLREALAMQLNQVKDIEVVGGLSSGEELVNSFHSYSVDIILMDIVMDGMSGLEATRWIKEQSKEVKVIIISSEVKKELVAMGVKCGIDGYLPKDVNKDVLVEAIHKVYQGEKYFNQAITNLVFEDFYQAEKKGTKRKKKSALGLTKRETEVLEQVASGKTNTEVAATLFISVKTVETHKTNILDKLGLKNTVQLVKYAIKNDIISLD